MMKRNAVEAVVLTSDNNYTLSELNDQTILEHCFDKLIEVGVSEIILIVGDNKNEIISHFEESYKNVPITYVHEVLQKGPAHAIKCAQSVISGDFILLSGNAVFGSESFGKAVEITQSPGVDGAVLVNNRDDSLHASDTIYTTDSADSVIEISENSDESNNSVVPTGFYVLPEGILSSCWEINSSNNHGNSIEEVIENYIHRGGRFDTVKFSSWNAEVTSDEVLRDAQQKIESDTEHFVTIEKPTQD